MKKLLVIANLYHASPRLPALFVYLADLGWDISIITPDLGENPERDLGFPSGFLDKVTIIRAPYRGDIFWPLRKVLDHLGYSSKSSYTEQLKEDAGGGKSWVQHIMQLAQTFIAFPDTEWPWHHSAFKTACREIEKNHYDSILSSSPFPTVHRISTRLKKRYNIPWIADFRDPWSQSHNYTLPHFRWKLDRWLELRTLKNADLIITVSLGVAEKLSELHNTVPVDVVRNGYQPVVRPPIPVFPKKLTISYTGTIYEGKQDPIKILEALKHLKQADVIDPDKITLEFYGRYDSKLQGKIEDFDLQNIVTQKGMCSRSEIRQYQMNSHLLLLFQWEDLSEKGIFPLKFYEYLDARRPILATGGSQDTEVATLMNETKSGDVILDSLAIADYLKKQYHLFLAGEAIHYNGDIDKIEHYSYKGSAKKLKKILDKLIS